MDREYVIDANILISSSRSIYPFDIAPGFWKQLTEKGYKKIILIDKIRNEIYRNEDQLSQWLKTAESSFVIKDSGDKNIIQNYSKIITSVQSNEQYKGYVKSEFASNADSWLCSHAMTYGYVIVTQEIYEPNIRKRVKIPNICKEFNIPYINLLQFMKEIGIRFD